MQIKIFNIPIPFGEVFNEELNVFLRSKKIVSVEETLVQGNAGAYWSFVVKYMDGDTASYERDKSKVDYKKILDEPVFARFAVLRDIRKKVAKDDAVPAYVVFSDEELIELAKLDPLTEVGMKGVKGIGARKVEKYGRFFLPQPLVSHETGG